MTTGWIASVYPNSIKALIQTNIQKCFPEKTPKQHRKLVQKSLMHFGARAAEYGAWWLWPSHKLVPLVKNTYGEHYLKAAQKEGRGILMLAPHLGAWEGSLGYLPSRYKCSALYRPLRFKSMDHFVRKARERGGIDLLPFTASGLREIYSRLLRGELVIILPDQVPGKNSGVFAPFFGLPAWTMTFASKLAQRTNSAVFLGYQERLGCGKGFNAHILPVSHEIYNPDLTRAAAAMNADIQACVEKIPEQYQWEYKRFKVQPPGNPKFY